MLAKLKERFLHFYEKNETKIDIAAFFGGFIFDYFMLAEIDDPISIAQQSAYLLIAGSLLYYDFLASQNLFQPKRLAKIWKYRQVLIHFMLGTLLNIYSLFFLKSASLFSSLIFFVLMIALMIANESKRVREAEVNVTIGLYVMCVFCFFSMMVPVVLGFVGLAPFILSVLLTTAVLFYVVVLLRKRVQDTKLLFRSMVAPGAAVLGILVVFYLVGWIPPVPLSVENMGVYHNIEKVEGQYLLFHENPWWRFWQTGDQEFKAEPADKIYFFAQIFSPARFSDSVVLHWYYKDPRTGWKSTDRIPMKITGGRKKGYRGFSVKQNYTAGEWRISVETTDGREIGRIYLDVVKIAEPNPSRLFMQEAH